MYQSVHSMMLQRRVIFVSICLFVVILRQPCCFALSSPTVTSATADAPRAKFLAWFDADRDRGNGRKLKLRHVVGVDPLPTNLGDGVATFGADGRVSGEKQQSQNAERLVRYAPLCFPHQLPTKNRAAKALKSGRLKLNNNIERVEGCRIVQKDDVLTLQTESATKLSDEDLEKRMNFVRHMLSSGLSVLYEDDHLAAVFKPAGVHTKKNTNFAYLSLEDSLPAILTPPSGDDASKEALPLPLAVHRLDVRVCGLVLVAKTRSALQNLGMQFEKRRVKKRYEAIVIGNPSEAVKLNDDIVLQEDGTLLVDSPIAMDGRGTLPARTTMSILESMPHTHWGTLSHLELRPETGRTHQLRLHTARIGAPMVGDDLYWDSGAKARTKMAADISETGDSCDLGIIKLLPPVRRGGGLYLQSRGATFQHPITGEIMDIEVPLIDRFGRLLQKARLALDYENN